MTELNALLKNMITEKGHITIADFMNLALAHPVHGYYMKQDPFGAAGDFITAPEISQIFGEALAIWCVHEWQRLIRSDQDFILFETGAGRGTLMADILRTAQKVAPDFFQNCQIYIMDISPVLTAKQKETLAPFAKNIQHISNLESLPPLPVLWLANEFFDALPIRQFIKKQSEWFERVVRYDAQKDIFYFDDIKSIHDFSPFSFYELSEESQKFLSAMADIISKHKGAGCIIDYGYFEDAARTDSFQAVYKNAYAPVLENIGDQDLTAHVDFKTLEKIINNTNGLDVTGLLTQSAFLKILGIESRALQLSSQNPEKHDEIYSGLYRLIDHDKMGGLFKVLTFSNSHTTS